MTSVKVPPRSTQKSHLPDMTLSLFAVAARRRTVPLGWEEAAGLLPRQEQKIRASPCLMGLVVLVVQNHHQRSGGFRAAIGNFVGYVGAIARRLACLQRLPSQLGFHR